jgi:hypothetical protein
MTATLTDDQAAIESENEIRRAEIRRRIAATKFADAKCERIREAQAEAERKKEDLAALHVERCSHWQAELQSIDKQSIDNIVNKKPHDDALDERRSELLGLIRQANTDLQAELEIQDRLLSDLWREYREAGPAVALSTLEAELLRSAPQDLRDRLKVLTWAASRASSWLDRVRANPDGWRDGLATIARQHAEAELARAEAAREKAYRAAVDY